MSKWISVKDRLPESSDGSVLAYFDHDGIDMVHIQECFDDITAGIVDGVQQYTKWYLNIGITHWMPLPEPPEQS